MFSLFSNIFKMVQNMAKHVPTSAVKEFLKTASKGTELGVVSIGAVNEHWIDSITNQRS